ncbi:MAG: orotidine 5'-phosphate decarboxylase [Candidatus Methylarchaceae archaeon HK01B]|nr:orotidine 5'-phosphate decarboxylase [Candidatus Methylarchaceae archaeon HK01B]
MKGQNFVDRIVASSRRHSSRVVLALDVVADESSQLLERALSLVRRLSPYIATVKLNYHLLLPLNLSEMKEIVDLAHDQDLQVIADLKLNDIASTNLIASEYLWRAGFDAVIANPFVGYEGGLEPIIKRAHELRKGVILLAYMSHKGAKEGYSLTVVDDDNGKKKIYELFIKRAIKWRADGIVVGGTDLKILSSIASRTKGELLIFSPGIGAQGGNAVKAIRSGADFIIIGRSIIFSEAPISILVETNKKTFLIK